MGLQRVLYLVGRFRIYEELYLRDVQRADSIIVFTSALTQLYAIILRFLAKAIRLFDGNTALRAIRAVLHPDDVSEFEEECQKWENRVEIEAHNCERVCSRTEHAQAAEFKKLLNELTQPDSVFFRIDAKVTDLWHRSAKDERIKILSWTSDIPYKDNHELACQGRTSETGTWLLEHNRYQEWQSLDESMILWLHGIRKYR